MKKAIGVLILIFIVLVSLSCERGTLPQQTITETVFTTPIQSQSTTPTTPARTAKVVKVYTTPT